MGLVHCSICDRNMQDNQHRLAASSTPESRLATTESAPYRSMPLQGAGCDLQNDTRTHRSTLPEPPSLAVQFQLAVGSGSVVVLAHQKRCGVDGRAGIARQGWGVEVLFGSGVHRVGDVGAGGFSEEMLLDSALWQDRDRDVCGVVNSADIFPAPFWLTGTSQGTAPRVPPDRGNS